MNILLLLAHSIEEHDQLKLLSELGYDVFSIGGYIDPAHPHDPKRPALPDVPRHPELQAVVDALGTEDNLRYAKERIPDEIIDWADVIICHHYEHTWLVPQWNRIRHKRVIWRTVGQSVEGNETMMAPLRRDGLQIVRYSPKERNIPGFAGEDALIRFYKDPDEWKGWTGEDAVVLNITQHLYQREPYTNWGFWEAATAGLPRFACGPGSEVIQGPGEITYDEMRDFLRSARCYLYTGTQPASYTLGLIEAMMTGIPVVSIGPSWMRIFPYGPDLFEGRDIAMLGDDDPAVVRAQLVRILEDHQLAKTLSHEARQQAISLFGKDTIALQWAAFLGGGMTQADVERRLAGAAA
jgi:glycosyltransferase involved in cell wall biosynthesis